MGKGNLGEAICKLAYKAGTANVMKVRCTFILYQPPVPAKLKR